MEILKEIVNQVNIDRACEYTKEGSRAVELRSVSGHGNLFSWGFKSVYVVGVDCSDLDAMASSRDCGMGPRGYSGYDFCTNDMNS